jgi:hypothetical protein
MMVECFAFNETHLGVSEEYLVEVIRVTVKELR